jgi:hypothetical protein
MFVVNLKYKEPKPYINNIEISILFISIFISFWFLYLVDNFGIHLKFQLLFPLLSVLSSITYILINPTSKFYYVNIGLLTTPMVIFILYNLLNMLSLYLHKRELMLRFRDATNRKNKYLYGNEEKYKITDTIFSFFIIMFIILWAPVFAAIMVKY